MKLRNMEPEKRNDFTASLNAYCDHFGIWDAQPDLWNDAPSGIGPNNGAGEGDPPANVTHLQGEKAGKRGDKADTNPHEEGTEAHATWLAGWADGQAEALRRNIKPLDPGSETQASA